ncbi:hypothetical protein BS47DRAFT_1338327 [Hydnum rufescens UP504]|uniref:Uncharacterized protein n=1 Tax=Hydnum rufescens UP504 TaxID=1448309 RepID=A0A9P6E0R0_9AGAM|nr:hypothetical protein BS47DRAFT_1338327 [Hydnum rufescens UP504]
MPTIPSLNHVHKVLIKFPKRIPASGTHIPRAHPSAPRREIGASRISSPPTKARHPGQFTYAGFWEAPPRFWNTLPIGEAEIEAIETGGGSSLR